MADVFAALNQGDAPLAAMVVDFPRRDLCSDADWDCVLEAAATARARTARPLALIASLPENMSEVVIKDVLARGLIPLLGCDEATAAIAAAAQVNRAYAAAPLWLPQIPETTTVLTEADSKAQLAAHGLRIPGSTRATSPEALASALAKATGPVVIKAEGLAHKSEAAGVIFAGPGDAQALKAACALPCESWLIEDRVTGGLAELLVGVVADPAHGYVLTLGAGGIHTEILRDTVSALLPVTEADIRALLERLRIAPLLRGYRGKPAADLSAIVQAVLAVQAFVAAHPSAVAEVEINPLIALPKGAVAVDALIQMGGPE
jgi:acyl-CoA synthetase (NDP forming)